MHDDDVGVERSEVALWFDLAVEGGGEVGEGVGLVFRQRGRVFFAILTFRRDRRVRRLSKATVMT